jgi:hypothetical protein
VTGNLTGSVFGSCTGSSGSCTGNAATATAWASSPTLSLAGDLAGSASVNATNFTLSGVVVSASTSTAGKVQLAAATDVKAASSASLSVTPAALYAHPAMPKAWVNFGVSGGVVTVNQAYNVSSVTRNGAGSFTISFTNSLDDSGYVPVAMCLASNAGGGSILDTAIQTGSGSDPVTACVFVVGNR